MYFPDNGWVRALEQQVRELQDSLFKRHPDSITAMLRAASVDEVKAEAIDSRAKLVQPQNIHLVTRNVRLFYRRSP